MVETTPSRPNDTPENSPGGGEDNQSQSAGQSKNPASVKDRKCQYCHQAFTSSSLGRHLDQFLFKKKPDGIHDVEEIRRIRSGITRRQARTSSGKRDTPERAMGKGPSEHFAGAEHGAKPREGAIRMMFNTPTWHATGVINDIPSPGQTQEGSRFAASQPRTGSMHLPDYASRGASAKDPDTMRALELALREVLDNIKAATSSRMRPRLSPFDFDVQSETFPSLCLQLLPPPPSLFSTNPFPSPSSFPLKPPGVEHLDIVRQAIRAKIDQWQSDQLSAESANSSHPGRPGLGLDANMISRSAQQHEDMSLRHLELAFKHWASLPPETRLEGWHLEITRAFAREVEKRKILDEQLARVQQEANQLRAQVEKLGSCQWPREFALFPPDTLPLPPAVARELDAKESQISPNSPRWDYDSVVAKWKRVVMHDKSMGRVGVGYGNPPLDDRRSTDTKPRATDEPPASAPASAPASVTTSAHPRQRALQPAPGAAHASSPDQSSSHTGGASAPSSQNTSPYLQSPQAGPHAKRPRLMNGAEGGHAAAANQSAAASNTWHPHSHQSLTVSNLASQPGTAPPSSGA
ncbi:uncharacterized protein CDV56_101664 [Aspergillus thermomutatus]|uniref:Uncharacterized protein n=1 Tax=Aspergillus thermomutatus TaxID=41047 RepID=A0A397GD23_ASPTH|nr:uncharacterized protein CDV56_101664 [Aspergillus thermomutatus]RHZ45990.1 hypothetical protein CDV56_101664 [Aspergillus thermomutatus]